MLPLAGRPRWKLQKPHKMHIKFTQSVRDEKEREFDCPQGCIKLRTMYLPKVWTESRGIKQNVVQVQRCNR